MACIVKSYTFAPAFQEKESGKIEILKQKCEGDKRNKRDKIFFEKHLELINNSPYLCSPTRKEKELFLFCFSYPCLKDLKIQEKEKMKKLPKIFGRYALKFLPLHPLSEKNSNRETSDL